jgi:predicted dehydrogenase
MNDIKKELELATLPTLPKKKDYKIGIIGAGFIVRNCHLVAYKKAGFNPYAITSLSLEQSKEVASLHNLEKVYVDWHELVDDENIEIIDIAVPPHVQLEVVEYICKKKHIKGILCQKPIAMSVEDAKKIVQLGKDANIPIAVNSNMRYDQSMRALKYFG